MMYGYGDGWGGMMGGWGGLFGLFFMFFGLLVLVGFVLLVVWAVRAMSGGQGTGQAGPGPSSQAGATKDDACEIARKRYASGEITKEQYEEICKTLGV